MVHKHKKQMTKMEKRIFIVLMIGIALSASLVTASWLFQHSSGLTGFIVQGDAEVTFESDFSIETVNGSNLSVTKTENITIYNSNGAMTANIGIIENITDVEGDGCNNTGDVDIVVYYDGTNEGLSDDTNFNIPSGQSHVIINTTISEWACPQSISSRINLEII